MKVATMEGERVDFTEILTRKIRWPTQGDTLFQPSRARMGDAMLADNKFTRLVLMTEGYKRGADRLVAEANDNRAMRDFFVYPVIFCYRHFLELSLKYLIATYGPLVSVAPNWSTHKLEKLWAEAATVLDAYGVPHDEARTAVVVCIEEFAKIDAESFAFRYPTERDGAPIALGIERLDLVQLRDVMDGISGYFNGMDGYLSDLKGAGP